MADDVIKAVELVHAQAVTVSEAKPAHGAWW